MTEEGKFIIREMMKLIEANAAVNRLAYETIISLLDGLHDQDIRASAINAFRGIADRSAMLSEDDDDSNALTARAALAYVEMLED